MTQPQRPTKRPSPLSVRLNETEWQRLRELAGNQPLSAYVKACVFASDDEICAQGELLFGRKEALARGLALLGRSGLASNIALIAESAASGSIIEDERTLQLICRTSDDIRVVRGLLVDALQPSLEEPA